MSDPLLCRHKSQDQTRHIQVGLGEVRNPRELLPVNVYKTEPARVTSDSAESSFICPCPSLWLAKAKWTLLVKQKARRGNADEIMHISNTGKFKILFGDQSNAPPSLRLPISYAHSPKHVYPEVIKCAQDCSLWRCASWEWAHRESSTDEIFLVNGTPGQPLAQLLPCPLGLQKWPSSKTHQTLYEDENEGSIQWVTTNTHYETQQMRLTHSITNDIYLICSYAVLAEVVCILVLLQWQFLHCCVCWEMSFPSAWLF